MFKRFLSECSLARRLTPLTQVQVRYASNRTRIKKRRKPLVHLSKEAQIDPNTGKLTKPLERLPKKIEVDPETGEYKSPRYGDWLHRAEDTLFVRDRREYAKTMKGLRSKYQREYISKFKRELEEFTRKEDSNYYRKQLRMAQDKERERLKRIRMGALLAVQKATRTRIKMDKQRMQDLREYEKMDVRRDVIREMIWEEPEKNWITKDNLDSLNLDFLDSKLEIPGLPNPGEYDTAEGLMRTSDKFFGGRRLEEEDKTSSITRRPIPAYHRKEDTVLDWEKEHAPWNVEGSWTQMEDDQFKKEDELLPMWWYTVDWDKAMLERNPDVNMPGIFAEGVGKLFAMEVDPFEDIRLLAQKRYWDVLTGRTGLQGQELIEELEKIYGRILPSDINLRETIEKSIEMTTKTMEREFGQKIWSVYDDFYERVQHSKEIIWESAKMNFDSGQRKLQRDVPKWKFLAFDSEESHEEFKANARRTDYGPNSDEQQLHDRTKQLLDDFEYLVMGRRSSVGDIQSFIQNIDPEELKLMYIWLEDLHEDGYDNEIVFGKGWGLTQYHDEQEIKAEFLKIRVPKAENVYYSPSNDALDKPVDSKNQGQSIK